MKIFFVFILCLIFAANECIGGDETVGLSWENYKTGEVEIFIVGPPDSRMKEFIPQIPGAQGLYDLYIAKGDGCMDAASKVMIKCIDVGEKRQRDR